MVILILRYIIVFNNSPSFENLLHKKDTFNPLKKARDFVGMKTYLTHLYIIVEYMHIYLFFLIFFTKLCIVI